MHGVSNSCRSFTRFWIFVKDFVAREKAFDTPIHPLYTATPSRQVKRVDLSIFRRNLISHWNRVVFYNFSLVGSISGTVWWSENRTMEAWLNAVNAVNYYLWSDERSARRSFWRRNLEPIFNRMMISDDRIYHGREVGDWAEVNPGS